MSERDVSPGGMKLPLKPGIIILIIVVIVIIAASTSSFYVVDQTEQAVVLRLGKYKETTGPGLNAKIPFVDRNYNVPTQQVQTYQFGFRTEEAGITSRISGREYEEESIMLTGDLNIVDVEWTIQFRIVDPRAWLFNVENKEKTISDISQSVVSQLVGDRTIFDVIGSERENIAYQAIEMMNRQFDEYDLGINVTTVNLKNIVPPQGSVQDAFEDVNKAIQDRERLINEGREAYNNTIPEVRGEKQQIIQQAEGYATERINKAKGDVARFLAVYEEYKKNPTITKTRLYIETMEEIFSGEQGTDLIDQNLGNFIPFKALNGQGGVQ